MKHSYKICVYAICKNEEAFVDRWMDSMGEADLVVVTDTGSTDETVSKLRARGAAVYVDRIEPWRFDVARNLSLEHVPEDVDICVCTDLDELFEEGWRQCLEKAWRAEAKQGKYLYNWSLNADGTPYVQFHYSKVHTRKDFKWRYPVHEWLYYEGGEPHVLVFIDGMVLNHFPDNSKSRASYLPLLEMAVEEEPSGDRAVYYLGREYLYQKQWQKCIETLKKHLSLPTAVWREERCASMRWIAKSFYELGNLTQAYSWYFRAIAEADHLRDPYIECAQMAYRLQDWPTVFWMTQEALKIGERSKTYVNMGYSWDHTPDDLAAIGCYRLGMVERSLIHARAALEKRPEDPRLQNNIKLIENKILSKQDAPER